MGDMDGQVSDGEVHVGTLVGISYSPWSEKARWALDHHQVAYRERDYTPMLSTPRLRWQLKRFRGELTVPAYFDEHVALSDSAAIVEHAEMIGSGPPLVPAGKVDEVRRWEALADEVASAGRSIASRRVSADPQARREAVPPFVPRPMRALALPLVALGVAYFTSKYGFRDREPETDERIIRGALKRVRGALGQAGGRDTILEDGFSLADIAMATALELSAPVDDRYIPLGPATRRAYTLGWIVRDFGDVLAWRDRLYAERR